MTASGNLHKAWKEQPKRVIAAGAIVLAAAAGGTAYIRTHQKPATPPTTQNAPATTMTPSNCSGCATPQKLGMMVSVDGTGNPGTWAAMTGTGTPITGTVQPVGLMVSVDGTGNPGSWAAATPSTFAPPASATLVATFPGTASPPLGQPGTPWYTVPAGPGGLYRACGQLIVTAVGTGTAFVTVSMTSQGHNFGTNGINLASTAVTTQWNVAGACYPFWADGGTNIYTWAGQGGVGGSPSYWFAATLEKLE